MSFHSSTRTHGCALGLALSLSTGALAAQPLAPPPSAAPTPSHWALPPAPTAAAPVEAAPMQMLTADAAPEPDFLRPGPGRYPTHFESDDESEPLILYGLEGRIDGLPVYNRTRFGATLSHTGFERVRRYLCATPCTLHLPAGGNGLLAETANGFAGNVVVVPRAGGSRVLLNPGSVGSLVGGILLVTFGGMGTLAGATLMGVSAAIDDEGRGIGEPDSGDILTAGAITLGLSAAVLALGIYLIRGARTQIARELPLRPGMPLLPPVLGVSF